MPETKFIADANIIKGFFQFIFEETDCRVFEAYSQYDKEIREFGTVDEICAAFEVGVDPHGNGTAQHFSLWSPSVMPFPTFRRIELKVKGAKFRFMVEGCGLFNVLLGGRHKDTITQSKVSYWTELGARQRCSVQPNADTVNWRMQKQIGGKISRKAKGYLLVSANQLIKADEN